MKARTVSVTIALLGITGLSTLLVVNSVRQSIRHEATARQVMHDFAALGAEGVGQRVQSALTGRLFTVVDALSDSLPTTRRYFRDRLNAGARTVADSLAWVGQFRATEKEPVARLKLIQFDSSISPLAGLRDSIRASAGRMSPSAYMGALTLGDQFVVFARPRTGANAGVFALSAASLSALMQKLIDNDPVLPRAITHGQALGNAVQVAVKRSGKTLATRGESDSSSFRAEFPIDGLFDSLSVVVTLAQSMAPALINGGVPSSSGLLLFVVMALTVLLVSIVLFQLRQQDRLVRLREDFVAGTSHELRTPLAQIRLFSETLRLDRVRTDQERTHAITVIERESKRLEHLVDNLLHFSRGDRITSVSHREVANAATLTREIVAEFSPLAAKAEVSVVVENTSELSTPVDAVAWRHILLNLLDNAVKYGGRQSTAKIELREDNDSLLLTVSDEGPGVPQADRSLIWQKFWRSEQSRAAGIAGTGIGLATVHDLVTQLGGVCFVDDADGAGARFHVRVPKAPV